MYSDDNIKLYKGMRVMGIDGSKILLPDTIDIRIWPDILQTIQKGSYTYAMANVLNHIAVDSILSKARAQLIQQLNIQNVDNDFM